MASSGNIWALEEETAVGRTFREVFHSLPPAMQKMPKDPSRKWPHITEIAKKMHPQLPQWLQDDRSMNAIKFRVPFAWQEVQEEQAQRLTDEKNVLASVAEAARAKEQEANDKMHAACATQREDATKTTQMSHEIESLKRKLIEEANRREEINTRALAEVEAKNALLYESGQALWKIMSHLQETSLPLQAASPTEIHHAHPRFTAEAVQWQPASTNLDIQSSYAVNDNVQIGAEWSMPIARAPKRRMISVSVTEIFGVGDPEI
jgi:hypothetical protein